MLPSFDTIYVIENCCIVKIYIKCIVLQTKFWEPFWVIKLIKKTVHKNESIPLLLCLSYFCPTVMSNLDAENRWYMLIKTSLQIKWKSENNGSVKKSLWSILKLPHEKPQSINKAFRCRETSEMMSWMLDIHLTWCRHSYCMYVKSEFQEFKLMQYICVCEQMWVE